MFHIVTGSHHDISHPYETPKKRSVLTAGKSPETQREGGIQEPGYHRGHLERRSRAGRTEKR